MWLISLLKMRSQPLQCNNSITSHFNMYQHVNNPLHTQVSKNQKIYRWYDIYAAALTWNQRLGCCHESSLAHIKTSTGVNNTELLCKNCKERRMSHYLEVGCQADDGQMAEFVSLCGSQLRKSGRSLYITRQTSIQNDYQRNVTEQCFSVSLVIAQQHLLLSSEVF